MVPPSFYDDLLVQYVFMTTGIIAAIASLLALLLIFLRPKLRQSQILFVGLALSDLLNSASFIVSGSVHYTQVLSGDVYRLIPAIDCTKQAHFFLVTLGQIWPTTATLAMSLERLVAIKNPIWYHNFWSFKMSILWSSVAFGFSFISSVAAVIVAVVRGNTLASALCSPGMVVGIGFSAYNYGIIVVMGTLSLIVSIYTVHLVNKRARALELRTVISANSILVADEKKKLKKQKWLVFTVTFISLLNFILTIIPNIISLLITTNIIFWTYGNLSFYLIKDSFCINSAFTLIAFVSVNPEFRLALLSLVKWPFGRQKSPVSAVSRINLSTFN